jgi:hypothetical protein
LVVRAAGLAVRTAGLAGLVVRAAGLAGLVVRAAGLAGLAVRAAGLVGLVVRAEGLAFNGDVAGSAARLVPLRAATAERFVSLPVGLGSAL